MAKKSADDGAPSARLTLQPITISLTKLTQTPVAQAEGTAAWHDTVAMKCALTIEQAKDMLKAMKIKSTAFLSSLPDEVHTIELDDLQFKDHSLEFSGSGIKLLELDEVGLSKFVFHRSGDDTGEITFVAKSIPTDDQHSILEDLMLEAKCGHKHRLAVLPPRDGALDLEEPDGTVVPFAQTDDEADSASNDVAKEEVSE